MVNEQPISSRFALVEVTAGTNCHIALIQHSGTESDIVYEIIIGWTSESALIIHPASEDVSDVTHLSLGVIIVPYIHTCYVLPF